MTAEELGRWLLTWPWWAKGVWAAAILGVLLCVWLWREGDR